MGHDNGIHRMNPQSAMIDLLLTCARLPSGAFIPTRIQSLARQITDWPSLYSLALSHGVLPLCYDRLNCFCLDVVPPEIHAQMRNTFEQNSARHRRLLNELLRLLDLFSARSLPVLAFGGPILAETSYPSSNLRDASDLQLLFPASDLSRVEVLLLAEGYRRIQYAPSEQQEHFFGPTAELEFVRPGDMTGVVLRAGLVPRHFPVRLDTYDMMNRFETLSLRARNFKTLSPEDFLLIHCLDGTKLGWNHLGLATDTAAFLHSHPRLDWPLLLDRAVSAGALRVLCLGLYLATDWLAAPLPPSVQHSIAADPAVASIASTLRDRLFEEHGEASNPLQSFWQHCHVQSSPDRRLRYAARALFTPSSGDWRLLRLPRSLFPLYYLVRPIRLAVQLIRRAFRRQPANLAPYVPSPAEVTIRMLALAEVGPDDVVYDIGCGDGRLIIEAARRFGARGMGVDLDPRLIKQARANARRAGVESLVTLLEQDADTLDLSSATVVMLYLLPAANLRLRSRFQVQLRPGARIVSHRFDMGDWMPDRTEVITLPNGAAHTLYLLRIRDCNVLPAAASGQFNPR